MIVWIILLLTECVDIFPCRTWLSMYVTVVCMFGLIVDKASGTLN